MPLIALYMLRSRRQRTPVSSVYLWNQVGDPVSSAVPWQRLRPTPLLLAQLAVLAMFALLLARPFFLQQTVLGPHTVFVVDTSGSMAMAGRLTRAVEEATGIAADVSEANLVSVVEAGPTPRVLVAFSQDREAVEEALASLEAGGGVEDLDGALRLARRAGDAGPPDPDADIQRRWPCGLDAGGTRGRGGAHRVRRHR